MQKHHVMPVRATTTLPVLDSWWQTDNWQLVVARQATNYRYLRRYLPYLLRSTEYPGATLQYQCSVVYVELRCVGGKAVGLEKAKQCLVGGAS